MNRTISYIHKNEILKIYLKFFKVFLAFFALGGGLVFLVDHNFLLKLYDLVKIHFELPFMYSDSVLHILYRIVIFSSLDILCILVIFIFAFSVFDLAVIYSVISYNGIKSGASTLLMLACKYSVVDFPRPLSIFAFIAFVVLMNLLFMIYSYHSQKYVVNIASVCNKECAFRRWLSHFLFTIFTVIIAFVLNVVYCLIIYLI